MDFVRFTWSLEKTHLTLIQRCALTVQLQPSIAHIPGGALSTLPTRNTKQHRDTDHTTIARSRFSPFGRTLLPPPMLSAIHRHPRSSSGEQKAALFHPDRSPSIPPPRGDLSSHLSFTAHRYAPLSSGSRSSFDRSFLFDLPLRSSSSRSHLSRNSNIPVGSDVVYSCIFGTKAEPSRFCSLGILVFPQRRPATARLFNGMLGRMGRMDAETRKCGTENWSSGCIHRGIYSV